MAPEKSGAFLRFKETALIDNEFSVPPRPCVDAPPVPRNPLQSPAIALQWPTSDRYTHRRQSRSPSRPNTTTLPLTAITAIARTSTNHGRPYRFYGLLCKPNAPDKYPTIDSRPALASRNTHPHTQLPQATATSYPQSTPFPPSSTFASPSKITVSSKKSRKNPF